MGGTRVFRLHRQDHNIGVVIETLTHYGRRTVMAQRFIPEIVKGDKRILLIDGEAVLHSPWRASRKQAKPAAIWRPADAASRNRCRARDREIAEAIGPELAAEGLLLVGLDVIGDYLTEINVTSPTGMREIMDQTGFNVAGMMIDAVESDGDRDE